MEPGFQPRVLPYSDVADASPPLTLRSAAARLRGVVGISLCDEGLFAFAVATTHAPYLRSLTVCGDDGDDDAWSGSAHCGDRDVVLARGARLSGLAMSLVVAGNCVAMLCWAPAIDAVGRKYVATRSLMGLSLGLAILGAAARLGDRGDRGAAVAVSLVAYVFMASTSGTTAAMSASASDLAPKDQGSQSVVFAIKWCGWGLGTVFAYGSGFFVLGLDLEDYSLCYFAAAGLALLACLASTFVLRETLPAAPAKARCRLGVRGLAIVARSRKLRRVVAAFALTTMGLLTPLSVVTSWGISNLGYAQETLSLVVFAQQVGAALGFLLGGALRDALPADAALVAGNGLLAVSVAATGFGAPKWPGALWGTLSCLGVGLGVVTTASSAVIGADVAREDQGIVQAACQLCGYVGGALGCLLGPRLYDPAATAAGAVARPFSAGAAIVLVSGLGLALTTSRARVARDDLAGPLLAPDA